jgi:threonine dehydrogenase-like Zn-dependent dehydrogenase
MKAIVNTAPNRLQLLDWPMPQPGPGQVRIRTGACAICATDLNMIAGWERTGTPAIPGHEWAGTVDAVGAGLNPAPIGRRCVGDNILSDGGEVGFEHPGGYGEYFLTEAKNLYLLPDDFPLTRATLIEPLSVCVRAMRRLGHEQVEPVLIFGDGSIGLLTLLLLVQAGVKQIAVIGGRDGRLAKAKEFGAAELVNYHELGPDPASAIRKRLGVTFATVVEASGSADALTAALELTGQCGTILVLGDYGSARARFPWSNLLHREIELIGSCTGTGAWPEAVRLAVEGTLPLDDLISHRLPAERFLDGLALLRDRRSDAIKVVLEWEQSHRVDVA